MAKMYYNTEEAIAKLGCTEEEFRALVRGGKLREFRDAGKLSYRVDDVDKLAAGTGGEGDEELRLDDGDTGEGPLEFASDDSESGIMSLLSGSGSTAGLGGSDAPIELGGSDTGSMLELEGTGSGELTLEDSGAGSGEAKLADVGSGSGELALEDTGVGSGGFGVEKAEASGEADSLSLEEVDKDAVQGMKKDDTVITNIGISVFDDDDLEIAADPMAKTMLTGGDEHLGLDGSGGGSGLLDLTRESDDTSLGAELLEGIDMGDTAETVAQTATKESAEEAPSVPEEEVLPEPSEMEPMAVVMSMRIPGTVEPISPAFTGLLIAATLTLALAGAVSIANSMEALPGYLAALSERFWFLLGGTIVFGGLCALGGWFMGQQSATPGVPKPAKPKKVKKAKKGGKAAKG